jgi:hypothetical protein
MITNFNQFRKIFENNLDDAANGKLSGKEFNNMIPKGEVNNPPQDHSSTANQFTQDELDRLREMIKGLKYFPNKLYFTKGNVIHFGTEGTNWYEFEKTSDGYELSQLSPETKMYEPYQKFASLDNFAEFVDENEDFIDPAGGSGLASHESRKINESNEHILDLILNDLKQLFNELTPEDIQSIKTEVLSNSQDFSDSYFLVNSICAAFTNAIAKYKYWDKEVSEEVTAAVDKYYNEKVSKTEAMQKLLSAGYSESTAEDLVDEYIAGGVKLPANVKALIDGTNEALTWKKEGEEYKAKGKKNKYVIYKNNNEFILQVNGTNSTKGSLSIAKAAAADKEKEKINEGAIKNHMMAIQDAVDNQTELTFKTSDGEILTGVPVEFRNDLVTFYVEGEPWAVPFENVKTDANQSMRENASADPLYLALIEKGFNPQIAKSGEIMVTVESLYGDTDYWFAPSNGKYHYTQVDTVNIGDGDDSDVSIGKDVTLEEAVDLIVKHTDYSQKEMDSMPQSNSTFTPAPEETGPKIVGKIDLPNDNKSRFPKKK